MIGLKLPARKRARDEAEKPFWISFADLMTALMVLFLVAVTVALFAVTQKPDEVAKQQAQRERDIQKLLNQIADAAAKDYPGVVVRGHSVDFGNQARFPTNEHKFLIDKDHPAPDSKLRSFVSKVILTAANNELGQKWLKRIVAEGFADQRGTYIYNLNLSLQRSERVLCVLLASKKFVDDALTDTDRLQIRELFLVGGSSFNALKASQDESRRIELRLEFLEIGEKRQTSRFAPLDDATCPLDL
ncbi:MAG TPA: flagellar motor protein MotB [Methylotenera sp.]|nr:flagellar motor protein MotB [Methylotenera sp.]